MERLQRIGILFALLATGVVIISLVRGFQPVIAQPAALLIGIAMSAFMIAIFLKVALVPERRYTSWVRSITGPNGRWLFLLLLIAWGVSMAVLASQNLGPQQAGAPALIGLFAGIFLFMGFIWSVIGE